MNIPIEKVYADLEGVKDTECSCTKCVEMCANRPCWGIPKDIQRLIDLGYAKRLMQDYWAGNFNDTPIDADNFSAHYDIQIISPAIVNREGCSAPFMPFGRCTFLTAENKCEIHALKPIEGRKANCDHSNSVNVHEYIARTWDTPEGKRVVEQFEKMMGWK
jgi:Fe-S-cluster containining protein